MISVLKANGEKVPFDADKIRQSLRRVKTNPALIEKIIGAVNNEIYDGIPTSKLYRIVFNKLKKQPRGIAGKFNLKRAIMDLGPTGYPFEKFIAGLWQAEGFKTKTGIIIKGFCVNHEVDVVAEKDNLHFFMECKFHSSRGNYCHVKNALYVFARFLDIEKKLAKESTHSGKTHKMWLVTNTRLTTDAETYGTCAGLELLSWDFPPGNGLRERIDRTGLHPITCLTSLSLKEKRQLLDKDVVLCRDLCAKPQTLTEIGIAGRKIEKILEEADAICAGFDLQVKE
jgi:hypothetical protein